MSEFVFFKVRNLQKELEELIEDREYIEAMATKITPSYNANCIQESEKEGSKLESYAIRLAEVNEKIRIKAIELAEVEQVSTELINTLDDVDLRRLLKLRFFHGMTWREIAEIFGGASRGYGETYVRTGMKARAFRLLKSGAKSSTK